MQIDTVCMLIWWDMVCMYVDVEEYGVQCAVIYQILLSVMFLYSMYVILLCDIITQYKLLYIMYPCRL